jgi:hypothetical protein
MDGKESNSNNPETALQTVDDKNVYVMSKVIMCRLLLKKYTRKQATARCIQIHGKSFDGHYQSGRFHVFWAYKRPA